MKKLILLFLIATFTQIHAQSQNISWAKHAGGLGLDQGYVGVDASGNVYVSGWFSGSGQFGPETLNSLLSLLQLKILRHNNLPEVRKMS